MWIVDCDILAAIFSQLFLIQGLRMPIKELKSTMAKIVDGDIPTSLISGFAGRRRWRRTARINVVVDPQVLAVIRRVVQRVNPGAVARVLRADLGRLHTSQGVDIIV